jgi:osmotically-inducible protein OsmY
MKLPTSLLSILCATLLLQGCAGGLIVAAGTAVAVSSDERSVSQLIKDDDLAEGAIDAVLASEAYNERIRINIIANNSYLLLVGQVDNEANKAKIENAVNNVPGVAGVYNQLRVGPAIGFARQTQDSWLTTKVKGKLTAHDEVNPLKIKVVTENAEVFLIGQVTPAMADYATSITSKVDGVKRVVRVFEVASTSIPTPTQVKITNETNNYESTNQSNGSSGDDEYNQFNDIQPITID